MIVRRTFLIRRVQEWEVPDHLAEPDGDDFDNEVLEHGTLLAELTELIDNDELDNEVLAEERYCNHDPAAVDEQTDLRCECGAWISPVKDLDEDRCACGKDHCGVVDNIHVYT